MPPTKKKAVRKKTARKKTTRKKAAKTKTTADDQKHNDKIENNLPKISNDPDRYQEQEKKQPQYIAINHSDSDLDNKNRLVWLIVMFIGLFITGFWFWTLRQNIAQTASDGDLKKIADQVGQNIDEIKNIFSEAKATSQQSIDQYQQAQDIEQLKNSTLKEIELNLDSGSWPEYISEPLKLSLKYPSSWSQKNNSQSITLASYQNQDNLPESLGQLIITKRQNPTKTSLTDWADKNLGDEYLFEQEAFVDFQPSLKYQKANATSSEIAYSIFTEKNSNIYEFNVYGRNADAYLAILEKIISTIKFLQ